MQTSAGGQITTAPLIPRPPHDPTSWFLNGSIGWRFAQLTHIDYLPPNQSLVLELSQESRRSLTEASGSFGGLTAPGNVAVGPDGDIYLLDRTNAELKRFDPCECRFQLLPCFGGTGTGARQLKNPNGIAISGGNLFVCDTGNHRLSVFTLNGFALRGHWQPPISVYQTPNPVLTNTWEPFDIAFDRYGKAFVTDLANGAIHIFSPSGQWEKCLTGVGSVTWIAIDCADDLYAVVTGPPDEVRRINRDGSSVVVDSNPNNLKAHFPCVQFSVDADGLMHLGALCVPTGEVQPQAIKCPPHQSEERGLFDVQGNAVNKCAGPVRQSYLTSGEYISEALDSELYRCQWHRVILRGEIGAGSTVSVSTYTAETRLTDRQVENLGDKWETHQVASEVADEWDCLVRSGGGRFLWLKLEFQGNGKSSPRIDSITIEFPRISLRRYLPAVFGEEPTSADFTDRFLSIFDTTIRSIETEIDRQARFYDPLSAPTKRSPKSSIDFLSWLASWIGVTLDRNWSESKRRRFLKDAGRLFDLRGTREGLWRELLLFLEIDRHGCVSNEPPGRCEALPPNCGPAQSPISRWEPPPLILEHFKLRRWLFLGAGRIGDQAVLWGNRIAKRTQLNEGTQLGAAQLRKSQTPLEDPFNYYAHKFTIFVPACCQVSESSRKSLENLLRNSRPATTLAQIQYVEPRFRIGFQSMIGFDSVIARYPAGVKLDQSTLGSASVLTRPLGKEDPPAAEIGTQSRIGTTTKLN